MNQNQVKQRNLKSCKLSLSFFLLLTFIGCSGEVDKDKVFKPSSIVNPDTGLDCSGIWEGSPLCLERNEALIELKKLDIEHKVLQLVNSEKANLLVDKIKVLRAEGDSYYNEEFYFKARDSYINAFVLIEAFNSKNANQVKSLVLNIRNLLSIGKPEEASESLEKILTLTTLNPEISNLKSRIDNYYKINSMISLSKKYLAEEDFENALIKINEAINLDSDRSELFLLKEKISRESDNYFFDLYIRNAYRNIDNADIKRALLNSDKAKRIFPNNEELIILVKTLSQSKKQFDLDNYIKTGKGAYVNENWALALSNYTSAFELSPENIDLKKRLSRIKDIKFISSQLNNFIKSPERLSSSNIRNNLNKVLDKSKELKLIEEKNLILLIKQASELAKKYSVMVVLNITSNGKTFLDIQKTAQYRPFESESLKLYPGKYTLIAKRKGMQSARKEVNILPNSATISMTVICEDTCRIYSSNESPNREPGTYGSIESQKREPAKNINISQFNDGKSSKILAPSVKESIYIKGAKINSLSFSRNLKCEKTTNNNPLKISYALTVNSNGYVLAARVLNITYQSGWSIKDANSDDRKVMAIVESALKKSRFKLPKVGGNATPGKVKHTVSIPKNFCES